MTLTSSLIPVSKTNTGRLKFIAGDPIGGGSLSGVIVPTGHSGTVLANGATLSNSGIYSALFVMLGTKFGVNGQLPNLLDGIFPIPKGSSNFPTPGATGGEFLHVLTLAEYPYHYHFTYNNIDPPRGNALDGYSNIDGYGGADYMGTTQTTSYFGGGGGHENMPPFQVGGYWLVTL